MKSEVFDNNPAIVRRERRGNQWYTVEYKDGIETSCFPFTGNADPSDDPDIKIWRVENRYGCGPYAQSGKGNIHSLLHDIENGKYVKMPLPNTDKNLASAFHFRGGEEFLSGFASWQQYRDWFDSDEIRNILFSQGFVVNEYEVKRSNVLFGERQILFRRQGATVINSAAANAAVEPQSANPSCHQESQPGTIFSL